MAGKLEYSLGLATSSFLGPLGAARGALAGFIGLATGGAGVIAGVFNEINRGGALKDLANRTQESVGNLFQLQFAFEQSGVAAGNVGSTLLKFQKSLSGVGEMGENTATAFQALGLSVQELRGLSSPAALLKVFEALNQLPRESATGVASTLFGRGAAGDMLQLARDSKDFARSLEDSARQAQLFQRNADAFDSFGDSLGRIKLEIRGLFAGLAENVTPVLNGILGSLAQRDFQTLGKIAELSLTVAFEQSVNFLANALAKLFAALPDLIKGTAQAGAAGLGIPLVGGVGRLMAASLERQAAQAPGFSEAERAQKRRDAFGWRLFAAAAHESAPEAAAEASRSFLEALKKAMKAQAQDIIGGGHAAELAELLKQFGLPGAVAPRGPGGVGATNLLTGGASKIGDANALERVGALFGGTSSGADLARSSRQVADNTARLLKEQIALNNWIRTTPRDFRVNNE